MSAVLRYEGIRLPPPTPLEDGGYPVTIYAADGTPLVTMSAALWQATHAAALCPHGRRHCFSCRHRLTNHRGELPPRRLTDAELLATIAG